MEKLQPSGRHREGTLESSQMEEGEQSRWGGEAVVPAYGGVMMDHGNVLAAVTLHVILMWGLGVTAGCWQAHGLAVNPVKFEIQ